MTGAATVAVLYARGDSCYKGMAGCDVWDIDRDARMWPGGSQVVAHPPCRAWGRMRNFAKPRGDEKALALHAVDMVRRSGGVLEHPAGSSLWAAKGLPKPGDGMDEFGGWTLAAPQLWWGHRAQKNTWFYIVGATLADIPQIPFSMDLPTRFVSASAGKRKGSRGWMPAMRKAEREATPPLLAEWLVEVARVCRVGGKP